MEYSREELEMAISLLSSTIVNCEKMQPKFSEGTSQASLLKNRIKALNIARSLLLDGISKYSSKETMEALAPIVSIIHKTTTAQGKFEEGSKQYKRLQPMIQAMIISKKYIEEQINLTNA